MKKLIIMATLLSLSCASFAQAQGQPDAKTLAKIQKEKAKVTQQLLKDKPALENGGDSLGYLLGVSQCDGLKGYMTGQLGVDTTYITDFCRGIMERVSIDPTDKKAGAYNAGLNVGGQIEKMAESFSKDYYSADSTKTVSAKVLAGAIVEALLGQSKYTSKEADALFSPAIKERQAANMETKYGPNRIAGENWLAENKTKPGVVTLPSGLQYKVLKQGDGAIPKASDKVSVNYEGHLIDGTEFDSSYKRNKPSSFKCSQVIKGWTEALCLMPVGSKWEVYIPQELAYGERNQGTIKPYSALIFTVELLGIEK